MNKKSVKLSIFLTSVFVLVSPFVSNAGVLETFNKGLNTSATKMGYIESGKSVGFFANKTLPQAIGSIIGVALSLIGVFFLGLIIFAGYQWMIARGNSQEVEKAKTTIINAVIGLVVVLMAYTISNYLVLFAAIF